MVTSSGIFRAMIASVLSVAISVLAQDPSPVPSPSAEQLTRAIEDATADLTRLAPKRWELPPEKWHEAEVKLTEAVNAFVARPATLEWEHVARGIQTTWRTQCPGACAMLCELALQRFDATAQMHAQLGMCKMALAQEAKLEFDCRRFAAEAASAFAASRKLGEVEPAFVLMSQALFCSLEFDAALADFDRVRAHPKFGDKLAGHAGRAVFLLAAGRAAEAVTEFDAAAAAKESQDDPVLLVRALALAGRKDDAVSQARVLWHDSPSPIHLTVLADVLAFAGRYDEALALSRDNPVQQGKLSPEDFAELRRTRAALEFLIGLRGKRPDDLREQLLKVLEHKIKISTWDSFSIQYTDAPDAKGEEDLNASPLAVGSWLLQRPTSASSWANDVLFAVCVEDAPKWECSPLARQLLERLLPAAHLQAMTGADALGRARAMLASRRMFDHAEGVLTASQLLGL